MQLCFSSIGFVFFITMMNKQAEQNRTLTLSKAELLKLRKQLGRLESQASVKEALDTIFCQNIFDVAQFFPKSFVDLLFLDPPYNIQKRFNSHTFYKCSNDEYEEWFESWFVTLLPLLKPNASLYICGDWRTSGIIQRVCERYVKVRNRITWEREKGRGAVKNWKNASEDIWFCTLSDSYTFNVEAVKLKRRVLAPYRVNGKPKDWIEEGDAKFRLTHPSNLWTDITVPFWSMPENTSHPTQKPEKLVAKIILASTNVGDIVFDPFLGSGTTAVVAKKLHRHFVGVEIDEEYACLALKRLQMAERDKTIQGYRDGVFWERNTLSSS